MTTKELADLRGQLATLRTLIERSHREKRALGNDPVAEAAAIVLAQKRERLHRLEAATWEPMRNED